MIPSDRYSRAYHNLLWARLGVITKKKSSECIKLSKLLIGENTARRCRCCTSIQVSQSSESEMLWGVYLIHQNLQSGTVPINLNKNCGSYTRINYFPTFLRKKSSLISYKMFYKHPMLVQEFHSIEEGNSTRPVKISSENIHWLKSYDVSPCLKMVFREKRLQS